MAYPFINTEPEEKDNLTSIEKAKLKMDELNEDRWNQILQITGLTPLPKTGEPAYKSPSKQFIAENKLAQEKFSRERALFDEASLETSGSQAGITGEMMEETIDAIPENMDELTEAIKNNPVTAPIYDGLKRLSENSTAQQIYNRTRLKFINEQIEKDKEKGINNPYWTTEKQKLELKVNVPIYRRVAEDILATTQVVLNSIPVVAGLNLASAPAGQLGGDIAKMIGGEEAEELGQTLAHVGLSATLGLPVLAGTLVNMGAQPVADKLLAGSDMNDEDKKIISEAVGHTSFIFGMMGGKLLKTKGLEWGVKNYRKFVKGQEFGKTKDLPTEQQLYNHLREVLKDQTKSPAEKQLAMKFLQDNGQKFEVPTEFRLEDKSRDTEPIYQQEKPTDVKGEPFQIPDKPMLRIGENGVGVEELTDLQKASITYRPTLGSEITRNFNSVEEAQVWLRKIGKPELIPQIATQPPDEFYSDKVLDQVVTNHIKNMGSTTNPVTPQTSGKIVSPYPDNTVLIKGRRITKEQVSDYVNKNRELLKQPNHSLGTWYNESDKNTYLDVVVNVPTDAEAQRIGRDNNQLAYFDMDTMKEVPIRPITPTEMKQEVNEIPKDNLQEVFHFSDMDQPEFTSNPKKFGLNSFTKGDRAISPKPRTFFYTNKDAVNKDHISLRNKNLYTGKIDMSRIYDLDANSESIGFNEYGVFIPEDAMKQAEKKGYTGVRYGNVIASFKPVLLKRPSAPLVENLFDGTWDESVKSAQAVIAQKPVNPYDQTASKNIVNALATVASDYLMSKSLPMKDLPFFLENVFSKMQTPEQFQNNRSWLRDTYEVTKKNMKEYKKNPLDKNTIQNIKQKLNDVWTGGGDPNFIPVDKGIVMVGGDALIKRNPSGGFKVLGVGYPEDRAIKASVTKADTKVQKAGLYMGETAKIEQNELTNEFGTISFLEGNNEIRVIVSGVNDEMMRGEEAKEKIIAQGGKLVPAGKGYGMELYEDLVEYARMQGKKITSDSMLSDMSFSVWQKLKTKYGAKQLVPESEMNILKYKGTDKPSHYSAIGGGNIFELDTKGMKQGKRSSRWISDGWATDIGVARSLQKMAKAGGHDTIVFMQYDNPFNSARNNWEFQKSLETYLFDFILEARKLNKRNPEIMKQLQEIVVPATPPKDVWLPDKATSMAKETPDELVKNIRDVHIRKLKEAVAKIKKLHTGREEQSKWTLDNLALKFAEPHALNNAGKILGVAKVYDLAYPDKATGTDISKIESHPVYPVNVEVYNYRALPDPIPFSMIKPTLKNYATMESGTTDVVQKPLTGNQAYRSLLQQSLAVSKGQAEIVDALITFSNGDPSALEKWYDQNPTYKDEIRDYERYNQWKIEREQNDKILIKRHVKDFQELNTRIAEAKKEYDRKNYQKLKDAGKKPPDSMNPDSPNYTGGTFGSLLGGGDFQKLWDGMRVVAKGTARGVKTIAEFASKMIAQLGEWIRPFLRSLWENVTQMPNIFRKVSPEEAQRNRAQREQLPTEVNKTSPENTGKTKDKTYSWNYQESITKGYNEAREHPDLGKHIVKILEEARKEFDVLRRGTISNEDLVRIAKDRATQLVDEDILDLKIGDVRNAEDIVAMRIYVADKLLNINSEVAQFASNSDPLTIKSMSSELAKGMKMYMKVRALGTEAGRAVQSFDIPMDDLTITAMRELNKKLKELDPEGRYGGDAINDMIEKLIATPMDKTEQKASAWELVRFAYLNYILSNPLTDMANTFGNSSNLTFHIVANLGNLGGLQTLQKGIKNGLAEGMNDAVKVVHGQLEAISKFTENSQVQLPASGKGTDWLKTLVPTTRLGMEDAFFRGLIRNIELERMTTKLADKFRVNPNDVHEGALRIIRDPKLAEFEPQYIQDMVKYLEKIEDELVFQKELGAIGKGFSQISKVAFPIIPFVKTPANILKFGISATPLGFAKLLGRDLLPEEKNQIIRRALLGSSVLAGIGVLVANGLMDITGGGSPDPYERDLMDKLGYKPNHIYIQTPFGLYGGSYQNANPLNVPLATAGDLFDRYRFNKNEKESDKEWYDKWAEDASGGLIGLAGSISDQSMLAGVKDFCDFLANRNPDWGMKMLTNFGRVGLATGIQKIAGIEDRGQYDTRGRMMEQFQRNFPLVTNKGLIPRNTVFGEQRQSKYERFPIPISEINPEPQYQWLADQELDVPQPSSNTKIGNRQMNRREYEMYTRLVGQVMDKTVKALYEKENDPENEEKLTKEEIQDKIDSVFNSAKKKAKELIIKKILEQHKLKEENEND